ncbi:hypothetical protein HDU67_001976, partial [Dinochytrium kinnereticum]
MPDRAERSTAKKVAKDARAPRTDGTIPPSSTTTVTEVEEALPAAAPSHPGATRTQ